MNHTTNYNFNLPTDDDFYDIAQQNENWTGLDTELKSISNAASSAGSGLSDHEAESVTDVNGVHGIRVNNKKIQYFDGTQWKNVAGGGSVKIGDVSGAALAKSGQDVTITWSDPEDVVVEGVTLAEWGGTKLVRKVGSAPSSETDGTLIVDNTVRDQYASTGIQDTGLTYDTTYYYRFFPRTTGEEVTNGTSLSVTPKATQVMSVVIDQTNSNPETCCTYTDDATGLSAKADEIVEFIGAYPVLMKNGEVVGRLKTSDFSKFEDGTSADISSGSAGDVMICFPCRGYKISTDANNRITVSITDEMDKTGFSYKAFMRGSTLKENLYVGAYEGYEASSKLRSLSGKAPTGNKLYGAFRTIAQANGSGYDMLSYYPLVYLQCAITLYCKSLDVQTAIGYGYVDSNNTAPHQTGGTNTSGMFYGTTANKTSQCKAFGLEDFWGSIYDWIDGLVCDSSRNVLTATQNFNDTGSGYDNVGSGGTSNVGGWISKVYGNNDMAFLIKESSGSGTTYFADGGYLYAGCVGAFGGYWIDGLYAGVFRLDVSYDAASCSYAHFGARLMYL